MAREREDVLWPGLPTTRAREVESDGVRALMVSAISNTRATPDEAA